MILHHYFDNETFLYHIWDGLLFVSKTKTECNKKIEIIFPGERNRFDGPDFLNAIVKIDDKIVKGDVEIHIKTNDWYNHKHFLDSNFNSMVLHVVYNHNVKENFTILENGNKCPILSLDKNINEVIYNENKDKFKQKYTPQKQYCPLFGKLKPNEILNLLKKFGWLRLYSKMNNIKSELININFNQLLYSNIMESLGYSQNKVQFKQLSEVISYDFLEKNLVNNDYEEVMSVLLGFSELWDKLPLNFPLALKQKLQNKFDKYNFCKSTKIKWNFYKIYPNNNPAIRIIQISELIASGLKKGLINSILPIFSEVKSKIKLEDIRNKFYKKINSNDFLDTRFYMGKNRADIILFNIVLPIILIYSQQLGLCDFENTIEKLINIFPKLPKNYKERIMLLKMTEQQIDLSVKLAIHQQGLLYLHSIGCHEHKCQNCISISLFNFKENMEKYL